MSEYEDEVRSPTGLERLAALLAATKENASAEISKLGSQVQALEVERRTLEGMLESCRDELGDAKSLVGQLRLENTRKWRVEERDDWRALLDSMQADRTALQHQNDKLEAELKRCIAALLSIFPSCSPSLPGEGPREGEEEEEAAAGGGGRGGGDKAPGKGDEDITAAVGAGAEDGDHPPELTQRSYGRPATTAAATARDGSSRAISAVDLEWLGSVAREFNVVHEEVADAGGRDDADADAGGDDDGGGDGGEEAGGAASRDTRGGHRAAAAAPGSGAAPPAGGGDPASECLRLRVELDALKHESNTAKVALESQVFEQEQELKRLRLELSREKGASLTAGAGGGRSLAGVFRWWRQDRGPAAAAAGRKGAGAGGKGRPLTGAVTVV